MCKFAVLCILFAGCAAAPAAPLVHDAVGGYHKARLRNVADAPWQIVHVDADTQKVLIFSTDPAVHAHQGKAAGDAGDWEFANPNWAMSTTTRAQWRDGGIPKNNGIYAVEAVVLDSNRLRTVLGLVLVDNGKVYRRGAAMPTNPAVITRWGFPVLVE